MPTFLQSRLQSFERLEAERIAAEEEARRQAEAEAAARAGRLRQQRKQDSRGRSRKHAGSRRTRRQMTYSTMRTAT